MKNTNKIILLVFMPFLSMAHGYWFEIKNHNKVGSPVEIQLWYGEYASQIREKGRPLDKMKDIKVSVIDEQGNKTEIEMKQTETNWVGQFTPQNEGFYQVLGINDTRGVQDWRMHNLGITRPIQYIRTSFSIGNATIKEPKTQFLDVFVANITPDDIKIKAVKDEKAPAEKTKITIVNPEGWMRLKYTNRNGEVSFKPNTKGMYMVELEWIDKTPGIYKDINYESIRYKCDMTFSIE